MNKLLKFFLAYSAVAYMSNVFNGAWAQTVEFQPSCYQDEVFTEVLVPVLLKKGKHASRVILHFRCDRPTKDRINACQGVLIDLTSASGVRVNAKKLTVMKGLKVLRDDDSVLTLEWGSNITIINLVQRSVSWTLHDGASGVGTCE